MNLKIIFCYFHYSWFAYGDIKIDYRRRNYQFRNNLTSILSDILWSLLKDTWMKIANERSHNGDEDGIIIVGERGAWKTRLHLSDN